MSKSILTIFFVLLISFNVISALNTCVFCTNKDGDCSGDSKCADYALGSCVASTTSCAATPEFVQLVAGTDANSYTYSVFADDKCATAATSTVTNACGTCKSGVKVDCPVAPPTTATTTDKPTTATTTDNPTTATTTANPTTATTTANPTTATTTDKPTTATTTANPTTATTTDKPTTATTTANPTTAATTTTTTTNTTGTTTSDAVFSKHSKESPTFGHDHSPSTLSSSNSGYIWWRDLIKDLLSKSMNESTLNSIPENAYKELYHRFGGENYNHHRSSTLNNTTTTTTHDFWELYPDVVPTLDYLSNNGFILSVISNFDERLKQILKDLDIIKYFKINTSKNIQHQKQEIELITTSIDTGYSKPNPQIFQSSFDKLLKIDKSIQKSDVVYIGDSIDKDYHGAKSFGFDSILLDRKGRNYNIDGITSVKELTDVLKL
eukprot:gene912-1148_t